MSLGKGTAAASWGHLSWTVGKEAGPQGPLCEDSVSVNSLLGEGGRFFTCALGGILMHHSGTSPLATIVFQMKLFEAQQMPKDSSVELPSLGRKQKLLRSKMSLNPTPAEALWSLNFMGIWCQDGL